MYLSAYKGRLFFLAFRWIDLHFISIGNAASLSTECTDYSVLVSMINISCRDDESNRTKCQDQIILSEIAVMKNIEKGTDTYYLVVDKKQTINGLQKAFNQHFPFLKIEFMRDNIRKGSKDLKNLVISTNEVVSKIQQKVHTGEIAFSDSTTVNALERTFLDDYGLHVQVFRKSGNIWLVTTSTDDWTLEQQNLEGESIAQHLKIEPESADDHDIY